MSLIVPPPPVRLNIEQEEKEKKREEKVQARLHTIIKVVRDEDLGEQIGKDIYFDLVNHDKVRTFRIKKEMPFTQFKDEVAKELGIPMQFQRFWLRAKRENQTYRPHRALTAQDEIQSVDELREKSNINQNAELKLFLEVELCLDLRPLSGGRKTIEEEILLFFKLYDPLEEQIRYVGRLFVKGNDKPLEIFSKLKEFAGFSADEEIELFEEIKFEPNVMCEKVDSSLSFCDCELENGDIICFQKSLRNQCSKQYRFPEVPSFLEYVHNHQMRLKKEQENKEQKGKGKAEAGLHTMIKVARDSDFGEQIGKEIYFDLVDHDKVRTFCVPKQMAFTQFKVEVAKAFGIPVQFQCYWLWAKRQNHTYRPDRALTAQEEFQSVNKVRVISNNGSDADLNLYLEVSLCLDLRPAPLGKCKEEILLFFKLYDPLKENIRYVGRLFVKVSCKLLDISLKLKVFAGFLPDEEIELYEEIRSEPSVMCEKIDSTLSFYDCKLEDGDIICFEKSLQNQCSEQYRFPKVPLFLEYVKNRKPKEHEVPVPSSGFPTKRHQPSKVAPVDKASKADDPASRQIAQTVDQFSRFTWTVGQFSRLTEKKLYSDAFNVGGYKWRILMFPKGNKADHLSIFLDVVDAAALPNGWSRYAKFSLAVLDQVHCKFTVRRDTCHQFNASESDWGFKGFMPLTELNDRGKGFLVDDKIIIEADISMRKRSKRN